MLAETEEYVTAEKWKQEMGTGGHHYHIPYPSQVLYNYDHSEWPVTCDTPRPYRIPATFGSGS